MWKVHIPIDRWMAGVQSFNTKSRALEFIERWNQVEVNSGSSSLTFVQDGKSWKVQPNE